MSDTIDIEAVLANFESPYDNNICEFHESEGCEVRWGEFVV